MDKHTNGMPLLQDYDEIVSHIQSEVMISQATCVDDGQKTLRCTGLWDTGSTKSCIGKDIADRLGLKSAGKNIIATANGITRVDTYYVNMEMPNGAVVSDLIVSAADLSGDIGVLIGMDVIGQGDFHIDNGGGRTTFSFQMRT